MAMKLVIAEINRLSQDEGLNDLEIANIMGCSRATINRNRISNDIPSANLRNRKDKVFTCGKCHKEIFIRRRERRRLYCNACMNLLATEEVNVTSSTN